MKKAKSQFFNRELSWVEFNRRVLGEALNKKLPLLERIKFLAITSSNFDEFFMVRVAGLKRLLRQNEIVQDPSGLTIEEQLEKIRKEVHEIVDLEYEVLMSDILPSLTEKGLKILRPNEYSKTQYRFLESFFNHEVFPVLTPLRVSEDTDFPFTGNLRIHAAFILKKDELAYAIIQIPPNLNRFVELPQEDGTVSFALLDDVVLTFAYNLFPGWTITESTLFKITRDAEFAVDEDRDDDFVAAMEEVLVNRQNSYPVRMSITPGADTLREKLKTAIGLSDSDIYIMNGPIDLKSFMDFTKVKGFEHLNDEVWKPYKVEAFDEENDIWDEIKAADKLIHLPYESFDPVIQFIERASIDPNVLAIKITLYRTSGNSPIVKALETAARQGKQVTAFIELKARFDEERNIQWVNRLEQSGVIVVYGLTGLKVHAKAALVVRRETEGIKRYAHLSTGNYNDRTAKLYTDLALFTANEDFLYDISLFFNTITGHTALHQFKRIVLAPFDLKRTILALIDREASRSNQEYPGLIMAKMNSLADTDVIKALYSASQKGVRIFLNIRGVCMLVPNVKNMSENINVISIVDRYLEHSRMFYFANGGAEELWLASADWMTRNLEKRVEIMFPILDKETKQRAFGILKAFFKDTCKSYQLLSNGSYKKRVSREHEEPFRVQEYFHLEVKERAAKEALKRAELIVRRNEQRE